MAEMHYMGVLLLTAEVVVAQALLGPLSLRALVVGRVEQALRLLFLERL
jgi:hypothetical protein